MRTTNKLYLRGYVGNEPKLFDKVCKVSIGTNRNWTDKKGNAGIRFQNLAADAKEELQLWLAQEYLAH